MLFPKDFIRSRTYSARTSAMFAGLLFIVLTIAFTLSLPKAQAQKASLSSAAPVKQVATAAVAPVKKAVATAGSLKMISTPIPHFRAASSRTVDTIVMHYISGINVDAGRWDDPGLSRSILRQYGVSAHYLVARDGTVYRLVNEKNVAYHAGGSIMPAPDNRRNVNRFSIGIEVIATQKSGYTEAQYVAVEQLVNGIRLRHPIKNIVGHDEISGRRAVTMGLRKDVKPDPGPLFDWSRVPGR